MPLAPALRHALGLAACSVLAAGCATPDGERVAGAVTTPLGDLNLVHTEIPAALLHAQRAPYALPGQLDCASLRHEVGQLDAALGVDLDTPATDRDPGLLARAGEEGKSAAVGALRRTAEGVVPFRSWIRKLSGAERHSQQVAAAIVAGGVRRGFLKGLLVARDCPLRAE